MHWAFRIFYYTLVGALFIIGGLLLLMQTNYIPGYDVRIVLSGSMEPAISTGSLVIVQDRDRYEVGDIIMFTDSRRRDDLPTTHRIIDDRVIDGELAYITKGDANDNVDPDPIRLGSVRGLVVFTIPYLGYVLDFVRQPLGFALIIGVPALMIAVEEIGNIYKAIWGTRKKKDQPEELSKEDEKSTET